MRADAQMEGGCLPLSVQGVVQGMTPSALALLAPWQLHLSLVGTPGLETGESLPLHVITNMLLLLSLSLGCGVWVGMLIGRYAHCTVKCQAAHK